MKGMAGALVFAAFAQGLAGCDSRLASPSSPSPTVQPAPPTMQPVPPAPTLKVFVDPRSGFSTPDVRDADDQVVQFSTANELIWSDGTRLPGYSAQANSIPAERSCACWLVVRFGSKNGERRAYMTADYIHDNPGTLVDLDIVDGGLVVKRTSVYAPGTYTLSGFIQEVTDNGWMPLPDAGVWRLDEERSGWQVALTDKNGFYELRGLYDGAREIVVIKDGYEKSRSMVLIDGDTRFDSQLVRH